MSVIELLRTKKLWIALCVSVFTLIIMCAVGAAMILGGVISEKGQSNWIYVSYLTASLLGGLIASRAGKGRMILSLLNSLLLILIVLLFTLIFDGGIRMTAETWKIIPSVCAGGVLAGVLSASMGKRTSRKKRAAPRLQRDARRR